MHDCLNLLFLWVYYFCDYALVESIGRLNPNKNCWNLQWVTWIIIHVWETMRYVPWHIVIKRSTPTIFGCASSYSYNCTVPIIQYYTQFWDTFYLRQPLWDHHASPSILWRSGLSNIFFKKDLLIIFFYSFQSIT